MPYYNHIRHVYFDLDKTLWDFDRNSLGAICETYALNQLDKFGFPNAQIFFQVYTKYNDYCWDKYRQNKMTKSFLRHQRFYMTLNHFGKPDRTLARKLGKDYVEISPYKTALVEGAVEILDYLKPNYQLHIITNGFEEVQHIKLRECKIDHYFNHVITSEKVGKRKPDPTIFQYALQIAGASAGESIMIGDDADVDIKGALAVGMEALHFHEKTEHLSSPGIIQQLSAIKDFL